MKTPVGFINSSYGGTPIEAWTSMSKIEGRTDLEILFKPWKQKLRTPYDPVKAREQYEKQLAAWKTAAEKRKAEGKA